MRERQPGVSNHAYDELLKNGILADELLTGIARAIMVEDYPDAARGRSVLVLQEDFGGRPVHVLWGIPKEQEGPAVMITANRPDRHEVCRFHEAQDVMNRTTIKLIHEGDDAAEVPIDLIEDETGWSPYLSLEDARKLDAVRRALREGDVATAAKYGRVFKLLPISA